MDILKYRQIKRRIRTKQLNFSHQEVKELVDIIEQDRRFLQHLQAYMDIGHTSMLNNLYDVRDEIIRLRALIEGRHD
jgi:hypothetical protein